jgi:L-ascorbate metabolism protein UlaG (beta-lactamase superfamily)
MISKHRTIALTTLAVLALATTAAAGPLGKDTLETTKGPLTIHPISHATFVMTWNDTTVYVDPVGGAGLFQGFPRADLVLVTHIHGDHTSLETLQGVSTETTDVVAPVTVKDKLAGEAPGRLTVLANGESFERYGITVEAVPAYNLTEERAQFHPKGRDNGYVVTLGGTRLYIAGDTEDIPEMRALEAIDAAFLCMNLPYTMTVESAADAVLEFNPKIVYPYHYRGKGGMSDLEAFEKIVAKNPDIEVRVLKWY